MGRNYYYQPTELIIDEVISDNVRAVSRPLASKLTWTSVHTLADIPKHLLLYVLIIITLCSVKSFPNIAACDRPLFSPYWQERVLSGVVIVTDEAPVLGWGGPGPGNDIMTGWPCTHITHHTLASSHSALTTLGPCHPSPSPVLDPFKHSLNSIGKQTTFSWLTYKKRGNESSWQKWIIATELFFLWPHDVFVKCSGQNHLLTTHTSTRPGHEARQTSGQHLEMPRITPGSRRTEYLCCVELQTSPMFNQS